MALCRASTPRDPAQPRPSDRRYSHPSQVHVSGVRDEIGVDNAIAHIGKRLVCQFADCQRCKIVVCHSHETSARPAGVIRVGGGCIVCSRQSCVPSSMASAPTGRYGHRDAGPPVERIEGSRWRACTNRCWNKVDSDCGKGRTGERDPQTGGAIWLGNDQVRWADGNAGYVIIKIRAAHRRRPNRLVWSLLATTEWTVYAAPPSADGVVLTRYKATVWASPSSPERR